MLLELAVDVCIVWNCDVLLVHAHTLVCLALKKTVTNMGGL